MTSSTNPTDDIIELTEIVEEGLPLDKTFEDFAMDKAVDSRTLDQELDDLLREAAPQQKAPPSAEEVIDLDILFEEPLPEPPRPEPAAATQPPASGMDMAELDDLFDSLGLGGKDDGDTALDIILDQDIPQAEKSGEKVFYPSDSIDLELDLPGLDNGDTTGDVHDLTEELPADIPETPLPQPPQEPVRPAPTPYATVPEDITPASEEADSVVALTQEHVEEPDLHEEKPPAVTPDEEQPVAGQDLAPKPAPEPPQAASGGPESNEPAAQPAPAARLEPAFPLAELQIIGSRLDALEARLQAGPALKTEDILALMPLSPRELPVTQTLRQELLEHVETRLADVAVNARVDGLQESVDALQGQVESIPDIRAELTMTAPLATVRKLEADLIETRALIQPREELQPEQILALLPQTAEAWPVAQVLRQEIIEHVETRIADLAANASVDGLQESVNALQSQVESIPDIRAELAKTPPLSAVQKLETELGELRALVREQADALSVLRQTLAEKDAALAELSAEGARQREELAALAAQRNSAQAMDSVRAELQEYVRQQAPLAAAKVVREEIQALLKELGG